MNDLRGRKHGRRSGRKKFLLFFALLIFSSSLYLWSIPGWSEVTEFFGGVSDSTQEEQNKRATTMLENLLQNGTLLELEDNASFIALVSKIADNVLTSVYESIIPSIKSLVTGSSSYSSEGMLESDEDSIPLNLSSSLGQLVAILLTIECLILGIESILTDKSFGKIVTRIITICIVLVFIAFLPLITKLTINVFSGIGLSLSSPSLSTASTIKDESKLFYYMPSDVLTTLETCKSILSIEKVRLGPITLPTLVSQISISLGEFVIALPFLYLCIMIVFWYAEMFLILLAGYIALPVLIFSKLDITDMRKILKSFILQGVKISVGIFLANLTSLIIINSLKRIDGMFSSTTNVVLFCIFMVVIIFFILTKGPKIVMSCLSGEGSGDSSSSIISGVMGGAIGAAVAGMAKIKSGLGKLSPRDPKDFNPLGPSDGGGGGSSGSDSNSGDDKNSKGDKSNKSDKEDSSTKSDSGDKTDKTSPKSSADFPGEGEVHSRTSKPREERAKTELLHAGVANPSQEMIRQKAIDDANIEKLEKMSRSNFINSKGEKNYAAEAQYQRYQNARKGTA